MKLLKDGTIEPCCDWVRNAMIAPIMKIDPYDASGKIGRPVLRITSLGGWFLLLYLNYCPNCGAKTEIEQED
ncbi:MAG: hypothetical protein KIS29_10425 [Thermoplasmata archaeon]|nr:hypothetical protein [Candidatus Sysuiplasma jiujiangense]